MQEHRERFSLRRRALNTPDPENAAGDETEVEITDLDSPTGTGNLPGRSTRRRLAPSPRERVWMSIAVIEGIVLLVVVVLVSLPHMPEPATIARMTVLPQSAVHPFSLSVDDGIAYASSPDGTVTALRVSDGFRLWRYEGGKVGETSTIVADGAVFLCTLTFDNDTMTVRVDALGASDGSPLWSRTLPVNAPAPIQLAVVAGILYVSTEDGHVFALRASDAFPLWQSTSLFPSSSASPTVADGIVYLNLQDGGLEALRASNGALLWRDLPPTPLAESSPIVADGVMYVEALDGSVYVLRTSDGSVLWRYQDGEGGVASLTVAQGLVYLALQTGNIDTLRASDGFVLWRYTPQVPATQLPPLVADDLVLIALQDGSIDALRTSDSTLLWHRAITS